MEIGRKIKLLRTEKGITQETLAAVLSVSAQAVSKWECSASTPDIQLLPEIAVYFGVTVDDLFCLTDDRELERIQNKLWDSRLLPQAEAEKAERWLLSRAASGFKPAACYALLADLYNHQARMHREQAAVYARQALEYDPQNAHAHGELCDAMGTYVPDWCARNRNKLIRYYMDFVEEHPEVRVAYQWLLDNLIADLRLKEARGYVERMEVVDNSFRTPLYRGLIQYAAGEHAQAHATWRQMEADHGDDWLTFFAMGDVMATEQRYEEAVAYYRRCQELQNAPRYVDSYEAIAQICEITGDISAAMAVLEEELQVLAAEWNTTAGETADVVRRELERLRKLK